jgi:hypothetical protein
MSIQVYEKLIGRFDLYRLIDEGLTAEKEGLTRSFHDAIEDLRKTLKTDV